MKTVNFSIPFEILIEAVKSLEISQQQELLEILENEIDIVKDEWESREDIKAEVKASKEAYEQGDYQTLEEFMANS